MVEKQTPTSDENPAAEAAPESDEISLEDIDQIIEANDPEFAKEMTEMKTDDALAKAQVESIDVDENSLLAQDEAEEKSRAFSEKYPKVYRAMAPLRKLKDRSFSDFIALRNKLIAISRDFLIFLKTGLPERVKYLNSKLGHQLAQAKAILSMIKRLSWRQKLSLSILAVMMVSTVYLIKLNFNGVWLPNFGQYLLPNIAKKSDKIFQFDADQMLSFYQAFPQPDHLVLLDKIVVNLRRVKIGENPMAAFQLFVNTDSQDTAIEVKDREKELLDRVARAVEDLSYREVAGQEGKSRLKNLARTEINKALNQGRIIKAYYKIIILKP